MIACNDIFVHECAADFEPSMTVLNLPKDKGRQIRHMPKLH